MKRNIVVAAFLSSVLCAGALAQETKPVVKVTTPIVTKATLPVVKVQPAVTSAPAATKVVQAITATSQPASQPVIAEPKTAVEAIDTAKQGVEFAKTRNWFGLSACAIFIIMFILNAVKLFDKIGKRWAYIILPVLGVAAMLLSRFAGGLSWEAAIAVLTSAPCTGLLWDFVKRGILAKEAETPMKPTAEPSK